jgi:ArsR family transcriptional regulator
MPNIRNDELDRLAHVFAALGSPHRLRIFLRLMSCCSGKHFTTDDKVPACVGELGCELGIVPSTVSHHIKELRQSGLIRIKRHGKRIECWIDTGAVRRLKTLFGK